MRSRYKRSSKSRLTSAMKSWGLPPWSRYALIMWNLLQSTSLKGEVAIIYILVFERENKNENRSIWFGFPKVNCFEAPPSPGVYCLVWCLWLFTLLSESEWEYIVDWLCRLVGIIAQHVRLSQARRVGILHCISKSSFLHFLQMNVADEQGIRFLSSIDLSKKYIH